MMNDLVNKAKDAVGIERDEKDKSTKDQVRDAVEHEDPERRSEAREGSAKAQIPRHLVPGVYTWWGLS